MSLAVPSPVPSPLPFALVIFDCDGVLIDSEPLAAQALAEILSERGAVTTMAQVEAEFVGLAQPDILDRLRRRHGAILGDGFLVAVEARRQALFDAQLRPIADAAATIVALGATWGVGVCVASNSPVPRLRHSLAVAGLAPLFSGRVHSADHVARPKPAPDLFLHAAAHAGIAPADCVVVEDSALGIEAARAAGMVGIGFCGATHMTMTRRAALEQAGAALLFDRMVDLPTVLALAGRRQDGAASRL